MVCVMPSKLRPEEWTSSQSGKGGGAGMSVGRGRGESLEIREVMYILEMDTDCGC